MRVAVRREAAKRRAYGQRVREVEGGTSTALVMSTSGGVGREFDKMIRKVAGRVVKKTEEQYSDK